MAVAALVACGDDDATASFTEPSDGDRVAGGVAFELAADGVTIEEAGEVRDGAGHFHVIADAGCVDEGAAIDRDADHVHLGRGQADGVVYLEPGSHELCVQVGDGAHAASDVSDTITVDGGVADRDEWCAVVGEVDELFNVTDSSGEEDFAVRQAAYEGIRRLLAQLIDGIDHVDADVRDDVADGLAWATDVTLAFTESADFAEAETKLQAVFADGEPAIAGAEEWISQNCGVEIDS